MITLRPLSCAYPPIVASLAVTPSVASITSSATSAASRCRRAITTLSFSAIRCVLPLRRIPAVSTNRSCLALELHHFVHCVARRPRNRRHNRARRSRQRIQQRALAHIRPPDNRHRRLVLLKLPVRPDLLLVVLFARVCLRSSRVPHLRRSACAEVAIFRRLADF